MMRGELVMIIEDVFHIIGRGIVVTGTINVNSVHLGQKILIDPEYLPEFQAEIGGIQSFRKTNLKSANYNDTVGLLLRNVSKGEVKKKMKIYSLL